MSESHGTTLSECYLRVNFEYKAKVPPPSRIFISQSQNTNEVRQDRERNRALRRADAILNELSKSQDTIKAHKLLV